MRTARILALAVLAAGCANGPTTSGGSSPSELVTATASPSATVAPTPTASPTAVPPSDAIVESFSVHEETIAVLIKNPNTEYGLARARFSLAAIGKDGSVIAVFGNAGLPGSPNTTIYQLPPQGEFTYVAFDLPTNAPPVASLELSLVDPWIPWETVHPIVPTLSGLSLASQYSFATLRGRVANPGTVTVNIWVGAVYSDAGATSVLAGIVDCVKAGEDRAFEVLGLAPVSGSVALTRAIAYPTTVDPAGSTQFC